MWQQLIVRTSRELAPNLSDAMSELGAISVSLSDSEDEPVFDRLDGEAPLWAQTTVTGLWPPDVDIQPVIDGLRRAIAPQELPATECNELADQDWERVWLDRFHPININHRLWITPASMEPPAPVLPTVYIDPGLAFGTGTHATTHLCLEWLSELPLKEKAVIDYGCGSGILAIAALKLGAARALGVDVDPRALEVSRDNARKNGVDVDFLAQAPEALGDGVHAPVVVANILAEPLIDLASVITALVAPGGRLALSGMLAQQVEAVQARYADKFDLIPRVREGWALLAGHKREI